MNYNKRSVPFIAARHVSPHNLSDSPMSPASHRADIQSLHPRGGPKQRRYCLGHSSHCLRLALPSWCRRRSVGPQGIGLQILANCLYVLLSSWLSTSVAHTVFAQSARELPVATQSTTRELIATAKAACDHNAAQLHSAVARGSIRHSNYGRDLVAPQLTLDADVHVVYDAPRFRLHLQYASQDAGPSDPGDQRRSPGSNWNDTGLSEQTILFDGQTVITVQRANDGAVRGDIYFDFHRPNMLRAAGFPFEHPIALWEEPLRIDRADLLNSTTTPLAAGGFMGLLTKDTYRMKYYFLGDFGYDLRRVSTYRINETTPFRDWHVVWRAASGVHYVERLVRRANAGGEAAVLSSSAATQREQIVLEYTEFTLNPQVPPEALQLSALVLPEETPFFDHRTNVDGKPKLTLWQQGKLAVEH